MSQQENFLHTTHRTITWFKKAFTSSELILSAPFQRNAVWTNVQKSYLLDTVLSGLPIPELYMQDVGDEDGEEKHIVVDGQQRIRAVLDFVMGNYKLEGGDVTKQWRGLKFEDLSGDDKKTVYNYKFVVRILPPNLKDEDIRAIFARLNKNVVSLTDQELRNATYWRPFIKAIQYMADEDPFWATSGLFSSNDVRRMNDHEYISELAIAYLHGPQNKKDRLNYFYQLYEEDFEDRDMMVESFRRVTSEISRMLPTLAGTRWKKKSDFYTLFIAIADRKAFLPFDEAKIRELSQSFLHFGSKVDTLLKLEEKDWAHHDKDIIVYARNVSRAASDRANRVARLGSISHSIFGEEVTVEAVGETRENNSEEQHEALDWNLDPS